MAYFVGPHFACGILQDCGERVARLWVWGQGLLDAGSLLGLCLEPKNIDEHKNAYTLIHVYPCFHLMDFKISILSFLLTFKREDIKM